MTFYNKLFYSFFIMAAMMTIQAGFINSFFYSYYYDVLFFY